jgi:hypothetical protein
MDGLCDIDRSLNNRPAESSSFLSCVLLDRPLVWRCTHIMPNLFGTPGTFSKKTERNQVSIVNAILIIEDQEIPGFE